MIRIKKIKWHIYPFIVITIFCFYYCGNSSDLAQIKNYKIDYYTTGGVTGRSDGLTVTSEGELKFWNGITITNRIVTDSLKLNNNDIVKLSDLIADSTIYSFKYHKPGNLTTVLKVTSDIGSNTISFPGTITGGSFPHKIKELIIELNELKNKR